MVAGLPGADILARGWPLAEDERADPSAADSIFMLLWTRATGDAFKAAGRPHTGKVFAWPEEAAKLDRYVQKLAAEYDNVYVRKYLAPTPEGAKSGETLATARLLQIEDVPAELPPWMLPLSFTLQTSEHKGQGFITFAEEWPIGWLLAVAKGLSTRLGADTGGSNPAQYTRVPTTRNTKAHACRFKVRLVEGAGPGDFAAVALPGGLAELRRSPALSRPSASATPRPIGKVGLGDEPWRDPAWRDDLRKGTDHVLPLVVRGRLLDNQGMPRGLQPHQIGYQILKAHSQGEITHTSPSGNWDASRERENILRSLAYVGYNRAELAALGLKLADFGVEAKGIEEIWLDICRLVWKITIRDGAYNPRRPEPDVHFPTADIAPPCRSPRGRKKRVGIVAPGPEMELAPAPEPE